MKPLPILTLNPLSYCLLTLLSGAVFTLADPAPVAQSIEAAAPSAIVATQSVRGVVLVADERQLVLLPAGETAAEARIFVLALSPETELPEALLPGSGDWVAVDYVGASEGTSVAVRVVHSASTPLASTSVNDIPPNASAADELNAASAFAPGGLDLVPMACAPDDGEVEPDCTEATLATESDGPSDEGPALAAECDDRFSFGKIIAITPIGLVLREYDFASDADVEFAYDLRPETEYGNVTNASALKLGDDVVVDYCDENGRRVVTTLVREDKVLVASGRITQISTDSISLLPETVGDETPTALTLSLDSDFETNLLADFAIGDLVVVNYRESNDETIVVEINHVLPSEAEMHPSESHDGVSDRFSFGRVVATNADGITVCEFDFTQAVEVDTKYDLTAETDYCNIPATQPVQVCEAVVVDYREEDGWSRRESGPSVGP